MKEIKSSVEYIEYLLKNYNVIKNQLNQMELELEHYEVENMDQTILGMSLGNVQMGVKTSNSFSDKTSSVAVMYKNVNERISKENKEVLIKRIKVIKTELKKLMLAIDGLEEDTKNIISDLYIRRLKWERICMRRYVSSNTINRHRKKGIKEISKAFFSMQEVA